MTELDPWIYQRIVEDAPEAILGCGARRPNHVLECGATHAALGRLSTGRRISIEFHVVLLREPGGEVMGIAAIVRDVTEHWQQDRTLRQRVQALEAEHASP